MPQNWGVNKAEIENTAVISATCLGKLAYRVIVMILLPHARVLPLLGAHPADVQPGAPRDRNERAHRSITQNSPKLEATQMSVNSRMEN